MQIFPPDSGKTNSIKVIVRDLAIPLLIGGICFALRERLIHPWCAVEPTPCVFDSVNALDRIAFDQGSVRIDFWTNVLQNGFGGALFSVPLALAVVRKRRWMPALWDTLSFGVVTLWNFAAIEIVRMLVQRPRPLVFRGPMTDGANVHQYTSFYSGHTSFTALAGLTLYYYVVRITPERTGWHRVVLAIALFLPVMMGTMRVLAGRHFPTDVIAGAWFGWALAFVFERFRRHRDRLQNPVVAPRETL
jgi:membrane-associated phospholipid phosphatase